MTPLSAHAARTS